MGFGVVVVAVPAIICYQEGQAGEGWLGGE